MSLQFDIRGFDEIRQALDKKVEAITKGVDREMTAATLEINAKQKAYTPVDTGRLRSGNGFDISKPLEKSLFNNVEYGPYIEFGTGGLVSVPAGLEEEAIQFKGSGKRQVNIRPQPFFYRAYFEEQTKLIERIKSLIKE